MTVRLVKCNSLDLRLFQFNYDLTFSVFFLDHDKTIYARYGTRSSHEAENDVHLDGLVSTMKEVLQLHANRSPEVMDMIAGKQPKHVKRNVPEEYSTLDHFKPELNYDGQVAKSCIHCHQVRDAMRIEFREKSSPLPEKLLYPYPAASTLGIQFDKRTCSTVGQVEPDSASAKSGMMAGDEIKSVNGQSIHSEADFEWILHHLTESDSELNLTVARNGEAQNLVVALDKDWRRRTDLSWRPTTWDLRRMTTGGLTLVPINQNTRERLGIEADKMALEATHVGRYGQHARARRAGMMREGDIIVSFDGQDDLMATNNLLEYALQKKSPGDQIEIIYLRNGAKRSAKITLQ